MAVDRDVSEELEDIIKDKSPEMEALPMNDFRHLFWDQQVRILSFCMLCHMVIRIFKLCIVLIAYDHAVE